MDKALLMRLIKTGLDIADMIQVEIAKEKDAKKRKKFSKAMDKAFADPGNARNILAIRELLFKV